MLISIIVPAFNEESRLGVALSGIQKAFQAQQQPELTWEIIVCDNNSSDSSAQVAREQGAIVVFEAQNQIARARNRGATAASGSWLLFIDADSYPPAELVTEMLTAIKSERYVGGGSTIFVDGGPLFNKLRMERLNPLYRLFNWCGGAFLFCRHDTFLALGGFSTDLYALEDVDFVLRLKKLGRRKRQKFIVFYHHPVVTAGRKAATNILDVATIIFSDFAALFLFSLHYLLPKAWRAHVGGQKLLRYWYKREA